MAFLLGMLLSGMEIHLPQDVKAYLGWIRSAVMVNWMSPECTSMGAKEPGLPTH